MRKVFLTLFFLFALNSFNPKTTDAIVNPLSYSNNRFGIHIVDENDLDDAANLVNSQGAEWGYVVLVIQDNQKDLGRWQKIFDKMRRLKLIPLIRLATHLENGAWVKPKPEEASLWADFLSSLNWVVKNRYVILFNEPNHANEWGNEIKPEEYGTVVEMFSKALKGKSDDFFILPAGLDAASFNTEKSMEISKYLLNLINSNPAFFDYIDGWTSHSYPNPNFSASPYLTGKGSIKSYLWEISYLAKLGLIKNLPIFITETGWAHREGKLFNFTYPSSDQVAKYFDVSFSSIWAEKNLVAIAPFLLNYQDYPFDHFSWKKTDNSTFYPQYNAVREISRVSGRPEQNNKALITNVDLPERMISLSDYEFKVSLFNNGESIWDRDEFSLNLSGNSIFNNIWLDAIPKTEPYQKAEITVRVKTDESPKTSRIVLQMARNDQFFGETWEKEVVLVPPPQVAIKSRFWFGKNNKENEVALLIYDHENLLKKYENITVKNGEGFLPDVRDIVPNKNYRFVLLSANYLPQQTFSPLWEEKTTLVFKRMLPFDLNGDGRFSLADYLEVFTHPKKTFLLFYPFD